MYNYYFENASKNISRNGKAIVYDKLVAKNDSTVFGLSKEEWKSKDIVDCIFDDSDEECNLIPNTVADLSIVSTYFIVILQDMLDEIVWQNASKFAIFWNMKIPNKCKVFFTFSNLELDKGIHKRN